MHTENDNVRAIPDPDLDTQSEQSAAQQIEEHLADIRGQAYQWAYDMVYLIGTEAMKYCRSYTAEEGAIAGMKAAIRAVEETS